MGVFQFVALAKLRALQLRRGCVSRLETVHGAAVTAQIEVAEGHIKALTIPDDGGPVNAD
jgi:hypothetical protein